MERRSQILSPWQGRRALAYALAVALAACGLALGTLAASTGTRDLMIVGSVALCYLALFIWWPTAALLLYIALRPLVDAFVFREFGGFTLGELWGMGMVASCVAFLLLENTERQSPVRLPGVPVAFLLVLLVLTIVRADVMTAVAGWTKVASWILVMLVAERISRDRRGQSLCWWSGIGMSLVLVFSVTVMIAQDRYGQAFYGDPLRRIEGQLPHPLAIGAVLLLPFALTGAILAGRRLISAVATIGLLAAVILSYVRTALIGGAIILVSLLIVTMRIKGKARGVGLAIAFGVVAAAYVARDQIVARFADLSLLSSTGNTQGGAGSGRLTIWRTAVDAAFDGPLHTFIGRGAGGSERVMQDALNIFVGAQNDLLDFLLDGGLVLAVTYIVLIIWMAASPIRILRDREQSANARSLAILALGAVAAFVVMSALNGIATYQPSIAIGLLIGLIRGVSATPGGTFLDPVEQRDG